MVPVKRSSPHEGAEWAAWHERAKEATAALFKAYEEGKDLVIRGSVYKSAKPFLDKLFGGKCAYCEVIIEASHPTEVEHYRPKGAVKDEEEEVVTIQTPNGAEDHPGYWWLAYEWNNLLPSCIDCNRR